MNNNNNNKIEFRLIKSIDKKLKDQLVELLITGVKDGDLGFSHPLSIKDAEKYWDKINNDIVVNQDGEEISRLLIIAFNENNEILGSIQLTWDTIYTNCKHRAEVQKLIINKKFRGMGLSKKLMFSVEEYALKLNKQLLILDTRSDHPISPSLYKSIGYISFGDVPFFSLDSTGYSSTTYFYKIIDNKLKSKL